MYVSRKGAEASSGMAMCDHPKLEFRGEAESVEYVVVVGERSDVGGTLTVASALLFCYKEFSRCGCAAGAASPESGGRLSKCSRRCSPRIRRSGNIQIRERSTLPSKRESVAAALT